MKFFWGGNTTACPATAGCRPACSSSEAFGEGGSRGFGVAGLIFNCPRFRIFRAFPRPVVIGCHRRPPLPLKLPNELSIVFYPFVFSRLTELTMRTRSAAALNSSTMALAGFVKKVFNSCVANDFTEVCADFRLRQPLIALRFGVTAWRRKRKFQETAR